MFARYIFVVKFPGFGESLLEKLIEGLAHVLLANAGNFREAFEREFDVACQRLRGNAEAREQRTDDAVGLCEQRSKKMHRLNLLMIVAGSNFLRFLERFLRFYCQFFKTKHFSPPCCCMSL